MTKSKKILIAILIISAILGLSAIALSYYLSSQEDISPEDSSASQVVSVCKSIVIRDSEGFEVTPDSEVKLIPSDNYTVEATFNHDPSIVWKYEKIKLLINENEVAEDLLTSAPKSGNITVSFDVPTESMMNIGTATFGVFAETDSLDGRTVSCTEATFDVETEFALNPDEEETPLPDAEPEEEETPTPQPDAEPEEEETPTPTRDQSETNDAVFRITATAPNCVERIAPNNSATVNFIIENTGDETGVLDKIVLSLPLGFDYTANSATMSKSGANSSMGSTQEQITNTGNSVMITWTGLGSLASSEALTIRLTSTAGAPAITGTGYFQMILTPQDVFQDLSTLRLDKDILVAQSCTAPKTSIFGGSATKLGLGIFVLLIATAFYYSQTGERASESIIGSKASKRLLNSAEKAHKRIYTPREYYAEEFEEKLSKKKK